jgi:hypothetical protein
MATPATGTGRLVRGLWVIAHDEEHARLIAQGATLIAENAEIGKPVRSSPWQNSQLTTFRSEKLPHDIPARKILTKSGKLLDV